jgi:hypothetical protein
MRTLKTVSTATYLDSRELTQVLGVSVRTTLLRARHRPWLLSTRVLLSVHKLLRWRQDVVTSWLELRLVTGFRGLRP